MTANFRTKQAQSVAEAQWKKEAKRANERHPALEYKENTKPQFPLNRVTTYPDGTEVHFDSTEGHSRYEMRHSSGRIFQIADDGMETTISVGNRHDYMKEGFTMTVDQNGDITINGHMRLSVDGGAHIEVKGETSLVTTGPMTQYIGGNLNTVVHGDHNLQITGDYNVTCKNNHLTNRGKFTTDTTSDTVTNIGGDHTSTTKGDSTEESKGGMTKKAPTIDLNP